MTTRTPTNITGCTFTGVHYDAQATEAIIVIAQGLLETARGLSTIAGVLRAQNVTIESMLSVSNDKAMTENQA